MASRWMNLVVIIIVVAAALFVYQTYFKGVPITPPVEKGAGDFEKSFAPVKELWLEKEIEIEPMSLESVEKIANLSDSELGEMKDRLTNYRNEMKEKEGAAAGAVSLYIDMVEYVKFSKQVDVKNVELDGVDLSEPCTGVNLLKQRNASLERKISAMEAYNEKMSMFEFRHKEEADKIGLKPFDSYIIEINKAGLTESRTSTASLEKDCG